MSRLLSVLVIAALAISLASATAVRKVVKPDTSLYGPNEVCDLCIQSMVQWVNELLNEGLGEGASTCDELCSYVKKGYERDLCDYTCGAVGLYEMIEILKADGKDIVGLLIYGCELVYACPLQDCLGTPCFNITQFKVHPPVASVGAELNAVANVSCLKTWIGTGLIYITVIHPDGTTFEYGDMMMMGGLEPAGDHMLVPIQFKASESHNFVPGVYTAVYKICNGQCDGPFPHDATLATANTTFKIVANPAIQDN